MPYLVRWTDNALAGLEQVYLFLAEKSEDAAISALKAIKEKALLLEQFPFVGRLTDDFSSEHRELLVPFGGAGYVFFYEVTGSTVFILAIKHQKQAGYLESSS